MLPDHYSAARFGVLVPVKPPVFAKSRLAPLGDQARVELARAFAIDTVTAALSTPSVGCVLAVTDDHLLAASLHEAGAQVLPDGTSDDLNGTLVQAAAELGRRFPQLRPVALCADLPALRPDELARVLAAADGPAFLADADGVGTTLVAAADLATFRPRFGPLSRRSHLEAGVREIDEAGVESVRRDVDTPGDLDAASALGVGPRTSLAVTLLGLAGSPRL